MDPHSPSNMAPESNSSTPESNEPDHFNTRPGTPRPSAPSVGTSLNLTFSSTQTTLLATEAFPEPPHIEPGYVNHDYLSRFYLSRVYPERIIPEQNSSYYAPSRAPEPEELTEVETNFCSYPPMPDGLEFLYQHQPGNGALTIVCPGGVTYCIEKLHPAVIGEECPLLETCFEESSSGQQKACIEAVSLEVVMRFLRFLYTGWYGHCNNIEETLPLLVHAQVLKIAENFDVTKLADMAQANISRVTELSCSNPVPPKDLCDTIRFIYEELPDRKALKDAILHYCANCFAYQNLGNDQEFSALAYELVPFHRDLGQINYWRSFRDDGAMDIIQLPVCQPNPYLATIDDGSLQEIVSGLSSSDDPDVGDECTQETNQPTLPDGTFTLVHRQQRPLPLAPKDHSEVVTDGFTLVSRPREHANQEEDFIELESESEIELESNSDNHNNSDSDWEFFDMDDVASHRASPTPQL